MPGLYLEDLKLGDRFQHGSHTITAGEIVEFARQFDPQAFHLDEKAARRTFFRGLVASGWHTASIGMRLFVQGSFQPEGGFIGVAVDELRWPRPTRPGDILVADSEIVEISRSASRSDRGRIKVRNTIRNQRGEVVGSLVATMIMKRRISVR
ncbi:MAG: MaoC family dehydratase [Elusimicrobia bacterium]|nr:MaoC family dehydratase [Elusimicrobiota bacterium]